MEAASATITPFATAESRDGTTLDQSDLEKRPVHNQPFSGVAVSQDPSKDPNIVDWDGPEDPENPMNWSSRQKVTAIGIVSVLAFLS